MRAFLLEHGPKCQWGSGGRHFRVLLLGVWIGEDDLAVLELKTQVSSVRLSVKRKYTCTGGDWRQKEKRVAEDEMVR